MTVDSTEQVAQALLEAELVEGQREAREAARNLLGLCTVCCEIVSELSENRNDQGGR